MVCILWQRSLRHQLNLYRLRQPSCCTSICTALSSPMFTQASPCLTSPLPLPERLDSGSQQEGQQEGQTLPTLALIRLELRH